MTIMLRINKIFLVAPALILALLMLVVPALSSDKKNGFDLIKTEELESWLTYLSSDELEGRRTFSEGLGMAAAYIAGELRSFGIQPGGDNGSYFQRVRVRGIKSANHSSITLEVNGKKRTFKNGEGIRFPSNVGANRSFSVDEVVFMGYGLNAPMADHNDYRGQSVKNKAVIWLGAAGPEGLDNRVMRRLLFGRSRYAINQQGAVAAIGPTLRFRRRGGQKNQDRSRRAAPPERGSEGQPGDRAGGRPRGRQLERPDFTTAQRLDRSKAPAVTGQDEFFEFLFSGSGVQYAELKEKASKREPLPIFTLKDVRITFDLNADYEIVRTQFTRNVVAILEGTDPAEKETYVAFGAHYDHVGYAEGEIRETPNGPRRLGSVGRVTEGAVDDRIWNGADDDGSGTTVLLATAKAFALGTKTKRSLLFIWHTGEERGLWGSRYFVDYAGMDVSKRIVTQINMDMVGRNRDNREEESNTIYLVGSDRISTELHNVAIDANDALPRPLTLDFEMNDPTDLQQVYYRSDHYSYAAKGIPIIFLTTGLHPDYHHNTDSVEKINFEKMTRIAQLVYEIGRRVANLDHPPLRDNKGPRVGKGWKGKLPPR